jgi:hypothetical protein
LSLPKAADVLDEYLAATDPEREPDGKLHPSALWLCDRAAVMSARGEPQNLPPDKQTKRVFAIGHLIHELIQKAMDWKYNDPDAHDYRHEAEFAIDEEHLTGHGDDLIIIAWLTEDEEVVVYEYKSTRSLTKQRKEGKASEHHIKQGATYCVGLARKGHKVKELHVVYFEKTNLDIEEFVYPYDPEWMVKVDEKIDQLSPYLDTPGEYPACTGESWYKNERHPYCPFYPICHQQNPTGPAKPFSWSDE